MQDPCMRFMSPDYTRLLFKLPVKKDCVNCVGLFKLGDTLFVCVIGKVKEIYMYTMWIKPVH